MAITSQSSFIPGTQEFVDHWEAADALLPDPITLPGKPLGFATAVDQALLAGLLLDLEGQVAALQSTINVLELQRGTLVDWQTQMLDLLGQFGEKVRGGLGGTKWEMALPKPPALGDAQSRFVNPLDDMEDLWNRINAEAALGTGMVLTLLDRTVTPPTTLLVAQFTTMVTSLKAEWRNLGKAELALKLARGDRNALQERIYPILRQYRKVLPSYFQLGASIVAALPRLTPEGGSTPQPAVLDGGWDPAEAKAVLSAQVPVQAGIKRIRLLYSPGTEWDEEVASVVESRSLVGVDLAPPVVFETAFALSAPGATALFRTVVINETDNEASSNVLQVTRP